MADIHDAPPDRLWREYSQTFRDFDDLTLARWCAQTLAQLHGRIWRLSHPLVGAYRLAAQTAHDRQIWFKRLVNMPAGYRESDCCRAPILPLFSRDVCQSGLICQHCGESVAGFDDLVDGNWRDNVRAWHREYEPVHEVAHWDDRERKKVKNYDQAYENAASSAERLLVRARNELLPALLEVMPALIWEDQDECLEVRPEDIEL